MARYTVPEGFRHTGVEMRADPSAEQRSRIAGMVGANRFAYNYGLGLVKDLWEARQVLTALALRQGARPSEADVWVDEVLASGGHSDRSAHARRVERFAGIAVEAWRSSKSGVEIETGSYPGSPGTATLGAPPEDEADWRRAARAWALGVAGEGGWSAYGLRGTWNLHKGEVAPWWAESSKECYSSAASELASGLSNWMSSLTGKRKGRPVGFPRFKAKGAKDESVSFTTGSFGIVDAHHIQVPTLDGPLAPGEKRPPGARRNLLRVHEDLSGHLAAIDRGDLRLRRLTITVRPSGNMSCAFGAEERDRPVVPPTGEHLLRGYDAGISTPLTPSWGRALPRPTPTKRPPARLHRANISTVGKALGVPLGSEPLARAMTRLGTTRERAGKSVVSMSQVTLDALAAALGAGGISGDPAARLALVLENPEVVSGLASIEREEMDASGLRRQRRRGRRRRRIASRKAESPEQRKARLSHQRDAKRARRRVLREQAEAEAKPTVSVYDRGWALPSAERAAKLQDRRLRFDRQLARQRKAQQDQARKEQSRRYRKARRRRARTYEAQADARRDFAHKLTTREARRCRVGAVETLTVASLMAKGGAASGGSTARSPAPRCRPSCASSPTSSSARGAR